VTVTKNDDVHIKTPIALKQIFVRELPETIHLTKWLLGPRKRGELKILFFFDKYFHNN